MRVAVKMSVLVPLVTKSKWDGKWYSYEDNSTYFSAASVFRGTIASTRRPSPNGSFYIMFLIKQAALLRSDGSTVDIEKRNDTTRWLPPPHGLFLSPEAV